MPFTPFHMGPGLALKAVAGRHLSLMVFGVSQVAMDLEVLVRIVRQDPVLHGFTHTYAGATLVGAVSAAVGKPLSQAILDRIRGGPEDRAYLFLLGPPRLSWRAAIVGAFAGTWSHVLLDSLMHADMNPWAPFADGNALLGTVSLRALHIGCILAGLAGMAVLVFAAIVGGALRRGGPGPS